MTDLEKTQELNPTYRQIDNFSEKELELIQNATNQEKTVPYDVIYNFYKFIKTLTNDQKQLYLNNSEKLWEELGLEDIENPYIFSNEKINSENNELINFKDQKETELYWEKRLSGTSHETLVDEMNLHVIKYEEPKKNIINNNDDDVIVI